MAFIAIKNSRERASGFGRALAVSCLCLAGLAFPATVSAVDIEELSPLNFGELAIPSNNSISSFGFSRSGRVTIEGDVVLVSPGSTGRLRLTDFPPNVGIEIDADVAVLRDGTGTSEPLSLVDYDFDNIRSNAEGSVDIVYGGTLETSGNGQAYEDGRYTDTVQFRFTFWNPDVEDYSVVSKIVSLETTLSTGLNIEEVQSLDFGTLFARTTPDDQASLTLSPDGDLLLNNPGDARLAILSQAQPGIITVTGAASDHKLSVIPQTDDVLLENGSEPSAPHFVLSDLAVGLSNDGRTDSDGNLEIRVGGTLTTEATGSKTVYPSGRYEGTYSVEISY